MEKIGFIGLGIMGRAMAANLLKAGYAMTVYDVVPAAVERFCKQGATAAGSPKEVAQKSDVIITMVPNTDNVREIVFGKNGLAEALTPEKSYIDCSSINPFGCQEICKALKEKCGVDMLDAPVSGGEAKAIDGTLSIMVGGEEKALEKVRPILEVCGGSVVLCGGSGAGNTTKLANQIIVAGNMMVAGEALVFAKKCGVDPNKVFDAIRGGLAGSCIMEQKVPKMLSGDFAPGGKLKFQIKDGNNVLDAGHHSGAPMPLTVTILEMIRWLCDNGCADDDHSAMVKYYERMAGISVSKH